MEASAIEAWREELVSRPRRNRCTKATRNLVRETSLTAQHLILPLFVQDGQDKKDAINAMPGCYRMSIDHIIETAKEARDAGVSGVALFPAIDEKLKNRTGDESVNPSGLLQRCVQALRKEVPEILVITDVALDPYSSDGHDGVVTDDGRIDNDTTVPILCAMAVAQAKAGAHIVAPSDMMDGRVGAIRKALDKAGFTDVGICSYCVKYASSFYGPFREALDSAPRSGDKKTYQMDPANRREALREVKLDEHEGADWLMVKPGLPYLDVILAVKQNTNLPVAAYHVSGEFAMLKAAAAQGWIKYEDALLESLLSLRRAGADMIFTYGAVDAGRLLQDKELASKYC